MEIMQIYSGQVTARPSLLKNIIYVFICNECRHYKEEIENKEEEKHKRANTNNKHN